MHKLYSPTSFTYSTNCQNVHQFQPEHRRDKDPGRHRDIGNVGFTALLACIEMFENSGYPGHHRALVVLRTHGRVSHYFRQNSQHQAEIGTEQGQVILQAFCQQVAQTQVQASR
jgi:hypothetical protein